jgi:SAM-dependent methyltransferase
MAAMRKPFQGTFNIIRFNWHFYVMAIIALITLLYFAGRVDSSLALVLRLVASIVAASTVTSLAVSAYVYDFSNLYELPWLSAFKCNGNTVILNINAGFDETSAILNRRFPTGTLKVVDFFDKKRHTELSIRRARKAYPAYPDTMAVSTTVLPFRNESIEKILCIFSLHEIRNESERLTFIKEMMRVLSPDGEIYVTEHVRDMPNFLAYNIGVTHFYNEATWKNAFFNAGLHLSQQLKTTAFVTTFILRKNGSSY